MLQISRTGLARHLRGRCWARCAYLQKGDTVAILAEPQTRPVLPLLARLAAQRLGAQVFTLTLPSVVGRAGPPARSTTAHRRAISRSSR
ncbi:MAG: hypothetical protein IPK05_17265 [Comamonadaceae bacterium]|nr:hypothetical protein [Comamonadaceae bacterium]